MYLKLLLIAISIFIGQDIHAKSLTIILFLMINVLIRKLEKPFLTNSLNSLDFNGACSLLIIFYSIYLSDNFDDENFSIFLLVLVISVIIQFLLKGIKMFLLVTLLKMKKTPSSFNSSCNLIIIFSLKVIFFKYS